MVDNLDGRQARKTKSSSPLGMMFDHGTDAIGSVLTTANFITLAHGLGSGLANKNDISA